MTFFSTTITPSTVVQSLMANRPNIKKSPQLTIVLRSIGTATYVAVGGLDTQDRRLSNIGEGISLSAETKPDNQKYYFDPTQIFISSDSNDAVIEIFGEAI